MIEGIMMRHEDKYSVAVRKPDGTIAVKTDEFRSFCPWPFVRKIPFVRGIIGFIDSMRLGYSTLFDSANMLEEDETDAQDGAHVQEAANKGKNASKEGLWMGIVFAVSMLAAVVIFMLLPYYLSGLLGKWISQHWLIALIEALLRIVLFLGYMLAISRMKDIHRTFMYHGAEHKCINCIENGHELTVENVLKSSRFHKRCGTSFLFLIVIVTAVLLMLIQTDSRMMRLVWRLILIPVIAGISYELLRWSGTRDNAIVCFISKPGLALQRLTTQEPDAEMAEVAIAAVEAVFDWRSYLKDESAG